MKIKLILVFTLFAIIVQGQNIKNISNQITKNMLTNLIKNIIIPPKGFKLSEGNPSLTKGQQSQITVWEEKGQEIRMISRRAFPNQ